MVVGPTAMIDPFVEGWAREAGIETQQLSGILGGDIIGGVIGIPLEMFLTQLGAKLASGALGLAGLLLGTYTLKGQGQLQIDTIQIASRIASEILDPSPAQIKEIQRNIGDLVDDAIQGRWYKIAYALIRNPRELAGIIPGTAEKKEAPSSEAQKPPVQQQPPAQSAGIVMRL